MLYLQCEETLQIPLHSEKLSVWCGLKTFETILMYLKHRKRWRRIILAFLISHVNIIRLGAKCFQLYRYRKHGAFILMGWNFNESIIKKWLCQQVIQVMEFDSLLQGYAKSMVRADKTESISRNKVFADMQKRRVLKYLLYVLVLSYWLCTFSYQN